MSSFKKRKKKKKNPQKILINCLPNECTVQKPLHLWLWDKAFFFLFFLSLRFLFLIILGCKTDTHTHTDTHTKISDLQFIQPEKPTNGFCLYGSKCPIGSADGPRTLSAAAAMFIHEIHLIVSVKFMMTGVYDRSLYNKTHSDHCCFLNHSAGEKHAALDFPTGVNFDSVQTSQTGQINP